MKTYTPTQIKEMLLKNDTAVEHGVVAIWQRQTSNEKLSQATTEKNGVGFNGLDANFLSSLAERICWRNLHLSPKQMFYARKAILKYAGQLAAIANENEAKSETAQHAGAIAQAEFELSL